MAIQPVQNLDEELKLFLAAEPFRAASPDEFENKLRSNFERLYAIEHQLPLDKGAQTPLWRVAVLGQLTEPGVHEIHFEFDKKDLDISRLEWHFTMDRFWRKEPSRDLKDFFDKAFPVLFKGMKGGYGHDCASGYLTSYQYRLPLSQFPNMLERVRAYHEHIINRRKEELKNLMRSEFAGFSYLCRASLF